MSRRKKQGSSRRALRRAIAAGLGTTIAAALISVPSQSVVQSMSAVLAVVVLLFLIALGVIMDVVGTAVAVAQEAPLHAMAAKRLGGARQALWLVRNKDRVVNFCNDIVGDLAGIISGAAGAVLVLQLSAGLGARVLTAAAVTAAIAGLTVAGKAAGKVWALEWGTKITLQVGKVMLWLRIGGGRSRTERRRQSPASRPRR